LRGAIGGSSTTAPDKGKQTRVILDDNEVSSDEDEPLHKRLRQLSGVGLVMLDDAAEADKEASDKRAMEEATAKRAAEQRAAEEAAVKAAAAEDVAGKTADEAAGAVVSLPAPGQAPSMAGDKRVAASCGSTPPAKCPYRGVWKPWFVQHSLPLFSFFFLWGFILLLTFLPRSSPSSVAIAMVMATVDVAIGATPGPAPVGEPRTPKESLRTSWSLRGSRCQRWYRRRL
jgi:hypothetical protein